MNNQPHWPGVRKEACQYAGCRLKVRVFDGVPTPKYCMRHDILIKDQFRRGISRPRVCPRCTRPGHTEGHCPEARR